MRRLFPLVTLALLALAGCLQMEQTVTLDAKGSGTHEVSLTMPESVLAAIQRAAPANQTAAASNPMALFDKEAVGKELKAAGIELVEHAPETIGKTRRVKITTKFDSPATLRKSPLTGSAAEWEFAPGPKAGTTRVTLYPQGKQAWVDARAKVIDGKVAVDAVANEFFEKRKSQIQGLDVLVRFRLPGKVIEFTRNLELTGEQEVTAHITAEQIKTPEDLIRRLAPRFEVVFDSSAIEVPVDRS